MIFVAIYFLGEALEQFWYWFWRHYVNGDRSWLTSLPLLVLLLLNTLILVGGIGVIKLFTADRYGHRLWIVVFGTCLLLAALSPLLPKGH